MKHILLISAIVMLTACGGGGSGGDTPAPSSSDSGQVTPAASTPSPTAPPASEDTTDDTPDETEDLVSNEEFDFIGKNDLTLSLSNNIDAMRVYLNVCNDYSTVNGEVKVDYNTCQLRTSLPDGFAEYQLTIGGDVESLVAQVWVVEAGAVPQNFYWSRSDNNDNWSIEVN